MSDEPLWLQSPSVETTPEAWLDAGDKLLDLMPNFESFEALPKRDQIVVFAVMDAVLRCGREAARVDPGLARERLAKQIGDYRARLGEFYEDY